MDLKNFVSKVFTLTGTILIMVVILQGCKKDQNGDGEYQLIYYWTPDGSGTQVGPFVETYEFKCFDNFSYPDCNILVYVDKPHQSGNWMSYPQNYSTCSGFDAVVTMEDGVQYFFFGNLLEPLSVDGLRASGIYDKEVEGLIVESGTFTVNSDFIEGATTPRCEN
jgi:hypothetical protein